MREVGLLEQGIGLDPTSSIAIASGVLALYIIRKSYNIYNKKFSAGARACQNLESNAKDDCIKSFRNKGRKAQIDHLKQTMFSCNKSKYPERCKDKISKHILKIKSRMLWTEKN